MPVAVEKLELARNKLYAAVISDILDGHGRRDQALPGYIRPLDPALVLCGPARTGLFQEVYHVEADQNPYEGEIAVIDGLRPGDVLVLACGLSDRIVAWGELMNTSALARGAAGLVTDGRIRDARQILAMGLPIHHRGFGVVDTKGRARVAHIDVPVAIGGVEIQPGDLLFGDLDGTVVVPQDLAEVVLDEALQKVEAESISRAALRQGAYLREVYEKYGVL